MELAGRRGLVIGVETETGGAIARALGHAGADLGLATMRADDGVLVARRIQRQLREDGRQATTYAFDVTLGQNVKVSTRRVTKELGGLDFVVSAPDLEATGPLAQLTDSDLSTITTVNFYAHLFAIRAAAAEFRRPGSGHALLVAHEARAGADAAAYLAAQAATLSLVPTLSEELRAAHVGVNALVVGDPLDAEAVGRLVVALLAADPAEATGQVHRLAAGRRGDPMTAAFELTGRHALVAGVGGPLARPAAVALTEAGATVSLLTYADDRAQEVEAQSIANECWSLGRDGLVARLDSTDAAAVAAAIARAEAQHGPLSVFVTVPQPEPDSEAGGIPAPVRVVAELLAARGEGRIVVVQGAEGGDGTLEEFAAESANRGVLVATLTVDAVEVQSGPHANAAFRAALRDLVTAAPAPEASR